MSTTATLSLCEVDQRLEVLQHNICALRLAAESLTLEADNPLPFVSLAQAFHDEGQTLQAARDGSPDDRYATLDHTMSNLGTIRAEADADAIAALDEETDGELRAWN